MQLDELKSLGGIADSYKLVSLTGAISVTHLLSMTDEEKSKFDGVVVVDNCQWAATVQKKPVMLAKHVYSSDGTIFGRWSRDERIFYVMELINNRLTTVRQIKLPPKTIKGGLNMELGDLTQELKEFGTDVNAAPAATQTTAKASTSATDERISAVRRKLDASSLAQRDDIILNNQKNGRALGFITKTNPVVKISVKKVPKLDAQGKKILSPDATEDVKKKYAEEGKVAAKYVEKEESIVAVHAKPSKPVAMIIATPAGSDVSLTKLTSGENLQASGDTDKVVHIISMETAYTYLAANYNGRIKEDDSILGPKATWLRQVIKPVQKTDATGNTVIGVTSSIVVDKTENRSSLLVDGNFFPLKVYDTISQQDLSPENAAVLNLNIEAAMKKHSMNDLSDESKKLIHLKADNSGYESEWFNGNTPIRVARYDDKNEMLTDVRLPRREKKTTKSGTIAYGFVYNALDDREHGPLSVPMYANIAKSTGMDTDAFVERVSQFGRANRTSKKKDVLTSEEYLRAKLTRGVDADGVRSFLDLQKELEAM